MKLLDSELDKLTDFWYYHRFECQKHGDVKLTQRSGGGIGTVTVVVCPCGASKDITDFNAW